MFTLPAGICGGSLDEVTVEAGVFFFREICKTLIWSVILNRTNLQ